MAESEDPIKSEVLNDIRKKRISSYQISGDVDYLAKPVSYSYFFKNYMLPNKLCVIGPWLTQTWLSREKWKSDDGTPNLDYLLSVFGDTKCPVADCSKEEYSSHPKSEMTFSQYVDYLRQYQQCGYSEDMACLYLKDWHCVRCMPDYHFYETPPFFQSDWLNEFWDERSDNVCDDYRFVYIGPKGSWTPFHSDVLRSFSWSANICGRKKWIFFPPGEEEHLKDRYGQLPFDLRSMDEGKFPNQAKVQRRLEVYQGEGEVVFVPSGWHHQVFNLEDTISINHNWLNGCNLDICWAFLRASYSDVMREISDCEGMEGWQQQCQLILKSTSGIDYKEFYQFVELIAQNRITRLELIEVQRQEWTGCEGFSSLTANRDSETQVIDEKIDIQQTKTEKEMGFVGYKTNKRELCEVKDKSEPPYRSQVNEIEAGNKLYGKEGVTNPLNIGTSSNHNVMGTTDSDNKKPSEKLVNKIGAVNELCEKEGVTDPLNIRKSSNNNVMDTMQGDNKKPSEKVVDSSVSVTNSREHVVFDLRRIVDILKLMRSDEHFMQIAENDDDVRPKELLERIVKLLET